MEDEEEKNWAEPRVGRAGASESGCGGAQRCWKSCGDWTRIEQYEAAASWEGGE